MLKNLIILLIVSISVLAIANLEAEEIKLHDFTLNDLDGNPVTLSELEGLVILDFWATWCPPCRVAIPYLQNFHDEFKDKGLHIVGVSSEDIPTQKRFIEQMRNDGVEMSFTLLVDPGGTVTRQYEVSGIPTTVYTRNNLIQIERKTGFAPHMAEDIRKIIERELLDE